MERAVEMNVGGIQETKIAQNSSPLESGDLLWVTAILRLCSAPWENNPNMAAELLAMPSAQSHVLSSGFLAQFPASCADETLHLLAQLISYLLAGAWRPTPSGIRLLAPRSVV